MTETRRSAPLTCGTGACSATEIPEERLKDIADTTEVLKSIESSGAPVGDTGVPKAIVAASAFRIGEDLIGLVYLLESIGRAIRPVAVWMVLEGQFAEGPLYLLIRGALGNAEHLIVITLLGSHLARKEAGRGLDLATGGHYLGHHGSH